MNLKIRTKIVLIALVSLLLAIGINATISGVIIAREYSDALQSRTLIIGQSLALQLDRLLKYGILLDEVVGFEKQCQEIISQYKDTSYAMVVDTEGKILFHNDPSQRGKRLTDPAQLEAARGTEAQVLEVSPRLGEGYFDATIPVRDSRDRYVAAVKVGLPTKLVTQRTQAMLLSSGAAALISLGLAIILLVVALPVWVTRPLAQLLAAVQEIGQKGAAGVQRVEVYSKDEVGQLASAFNSMAQQIRELVGSLEQRTRELEASQRVTFAASERATPEELFDLVVNLIRDQFDLYHAQVYSVDEQAQAAVLRQSTGYAGRQLLQHKHKIPLGATSLVTKVIHTGEAVLVDDVSQEPNFMPNPLLPETRSELVVPLKREGKVIGVLDTQDRTPGRFGKSTVALFQTMADQIAILFENSALLGRVTEQTKRLSLFTTQLSTAAEVARRLSTILDPEYLLNETVELVNSRFGFYHVHIYLLHPDNQLVVRAGSGEVGRILKERKHSISLHHEKSVIAHAARERVTQWVDDTSLEADYVPNPLLSQTRSELAVPLMAGDKVLGVLDIQDDEPERFSQTERDTFATLAGQVATALQNAQSFEAQKQAEAALREANVRVQAVLDAATQMSIISTDPNGLITVFNTGAERMLGYQASEMVGKQTAAIVHLESEVVARGKELTAEFGRPIEGFDVFVEYARQGKYEERDWTYVTKSGVHLIVTLAVTALRDSTGHITGFLGMAKDITERKQAEEAVQESRTRFQGLVETLSDWIWEVNPNGAYTYVSPKVKDLLGYEPEEVLGKTPFDFMPAEEAQRVVGVFGPLLSTQQPLVALENTNQHKDGHLVVFETSGLPFFDAAGQFKGYRGTDRDITERKQAELEIQKRATDLKTVAEVSTAASTTLETGRLLQAVVDLTKSNFNLYHAHIYLINEAGDTLTLAAGAGEVGRQMTTQGWQIPLTRERSLVAQAARTRQGVIANDVRAEPDYMPNPLLPDTRSELAVPLIMGDKVLGVLDVQSDRIGRFTQEDVTIQSTLAAQVATALENARLFEEVKLTAERLHEVDRLKGEFLASMSHELRTPLNSIIGYSEVILMGIDGSVDSETHEDVQAIYDNGQHLLTLINDILDMTKIEAGRMSLKIEPVDVVTLLDEVKSKSVGLLHKNKKPLELIVTAEQDLEPIQADRLRLSQVLNNLVSNAIKFTDQGRVSLHAFRENGWMCLKVEDTGCGISEADQDKLFERFRQVDGSDKRRAEGTGLGLAITRSLIELHGGNISVSSKLGQGSIFTVRLPMDGSAAVHNN